MSRGAPSGRAESSAFHGIVSAVLLQGIAVGGFNVIDVHGLSDALSVPVLVVTRRPPKLAAMRQALFCASPPDRPAVRGAARKWELVERAGPGPGDDPPRQRARGATARAPHRRRRDHRGQPRALVTLQARGAKRTRAATDP